MEELIGERKTEDKAKNFASSIKGFQSSLLINLEGNLGAGKTTFVRGLIQELGFNEFIKSPTFTIVESYESENLKVFQKRIDGLEYSVDHLGDKWYIRTNMNGAQNFKLMQCDEEYTSSKNWQEFIQHRENILLEGVEVFDDFMVITERENEIQKFISKEYWSIQTELYFPIKFLMLL